MIVAGHQPQYLPYIGLFNKIAKADVFCYLDNVQFSKDSWQKRTLIKTKKDEEIYLSIPVKSSGRFPELIKDVEIADSKALLKHLRLIELNYKKTTFFDETFWDISKIYNSNLKYLIDLTIPLMNYFIEKLDIKVKLLVNSEAEISGNKMDLFINTCLKTGCDTILHGQGAKSYFDIEKFKKYNLKYLFNNFVHPVYKQTGNKFLEGMAIIDLFFNEGIENARKIFWDNINNYPKFESEVNEVNNL